jgi:uncharacterized membrane protein YeaQ/YmgE (transglycosylase-associated protein family)
MKKMTVQNLLILLLIGAIAGWLAGKITSGKGFGLIGNIIVGLIGAVIGGYLFGLLGLTAGGFIGMIITAFVGAIVLLFVVGLIRKG